jgi:hypothetical protein
LKDFMEAGKERLTREMVRDASLDLPIMCNSGLHNFYLGKL